MRLPDFVIIGAMRSGTTSLFDILGTHPGVYAPGLKEPDFFIADDLGSRDLDWYAATFAPARPDQITGEASATYTRSLEHPGIPARMARTVPEAKLVYVLREPVARMVSHYAYSWTVWGERRPPAEALADPLFSDPSRYGHQLSLFQEHFPAEQVLVVLFEDLRDRPREVVARVAAHIGLEQPELADPTLASNARETLKQESPLRRAVREKLPVLTMRYQQVVPPAVRARIKSSLDRSAPPVPEVTDADTAAARALFAADRAVLTGLRDLDLSAWG